VRLSGNVAAALVFVEVFEAVFERGFFEIGIPCDPQPLSPQIQALRAILERLDPHKPQPIPDTASTG
jgi:hypothetical protein